MALWRSGGHEGAFRRCGRFPDLPRCRRAAGQRRHPGQGVAESDGDGCGRSRLPAAFLHVGGGAVRGDQGRSWPLPTWSAGLSSGPRAGRADERAMLRSAARRAGRSQAMSPAASSRVMGGDAVDLVREKRHLRHGGGETDRRPRRHRPNRLGEHQPAHWGLAGTKGDPNRRLRELRAAVVALQRAVRAERVGPASVSFEPADHRHRGRTGVGDGGVHGARRVRAQGHRQRQGGRHRPLTRRPAARRCAPPLHLAVSDGEGALSPAFDHPEPENREGRPRRREITVLAPPARKRPFGGCYQIEITYGR